MTRTIHAIHQFHSGSAYGDAVTNSMIFIRNILRELGFHSEIYVQYVAPELKNEVLSYTTYTSRDDQVLFVHHSMGHDVMDWIRQLPDEKYLIYHNITPEHFFPHGSPLNYYSQLGRKQLDLLKQVVKGSICVSYLNQQELIQMGYDNTTVIPLLVDIGALWNKPWNQEIEIRYSDYFNVLFVGRIARNKCQHDIIEIGRYLRSILRVPFKIHLVGGYDPDDGYYRELLNMINRYQMADTINIAGKVPEKDLYGYYRVADLFVCMSEHEGFGVPLIEAMVFNVPVVAYNSSNIPHTLGDAGILVNAKRYDEIASFIEYLLQHRSLMKRVVEQQRRRLQSYSLPTLIRQLVTYLKENGIEPPRSPQEMIQTDRSASVHYRIEGPFDSSYSLAIVNRELALALNARYPDKIELYSTEGPGDYLPAHDEIPRHIREMWEKSSSVPYAHAVIRNLYPPRVSNMNGKIRILGIYGWEESEFPSPWVNSFHAHLDGIATLSNYVAGVLINNGVSLPIKATGIGVDHCLAVKEKRYFKSLGKGFRFLHISSGFPRKGFDVLLKAYAMAFSDRDDVSLVVKTFPNPHNTVQDHIDEIRRTNKNCPDIILINEDLEFNYIIDLYKRCHALVAPSRGEGFGLPMAEAMVFELPVITTAYGGQCDFCTDDTAWLIDFSFAYAKTHMGLSDSVWVEPSVEHLAALMKEIVVQPADSVRARTARAKKNILENFTWNRCAERLDRFVHTIDSCDDTQEHRIRLGWVSSWGTQCGIASYSRYLLQHFDRAYFDITIFSNTPHGAYTDCGNSVICCWKDASENSLDRLYSEVISNNIECLVIQFNFGFFNIAAFGELIDSLCEKGIIIIIMMHSTADVDKPDFHASLSCISDSLKKVRRIFVHSVKDLNHLKGYGVVSNTAIFPHGVVESPQVDGSMLKKEMVWGDKKIIASYGFLLPHKGIIELIKAFGIVHGSIPGSHLLLINAAYPGGESISLINECTSLVRSLDLETHVTLITDFLEDAESLSLLSTADVIVYPYQHTQESSSAAVRHGLASGKPVLCSPLPIFDDVAPVIRYLPGIDPESIAEGITSILQENQHVLRESQFDWLRSHSWKHLAHRLMNIIVSLHQPDQAISPPDTDLSGVSPLSRLCEE